MLKNLLKYDFKSVFRYWWIAALSSLFLSIGGGGCITLLASEKDFPGIIYALAIIGLVLTIVSYVVFSILSMILVFTRFYKNFFTDEGYLTFTLPVKRHQLLNSKLILSVTTILVTNFMCIVNVLTMLCIGFADEIFTRSFWDNFADIINTIVQETGWYLALYILEFFAFLILSVVFSSLFLFCCITFASIITKKAKVLTAIGIYYAAYSIFSFVLQIFYMFGLPSLAYWLSELPAAALQPVIVLLILGILLSITIFCGMLYALQYWMIDRKLNLN